ncbi:MAG TPA: hypothetical protein VIM99_07405 [Blastocatellia bacterium]
MVKDILHSIAAAAKRLFANWAALLISLSMYLALLGAIYLFFTTREATMTQVALSFILPIAAVALFFLIQAMGLSYVRVGVGAAYLLKRSFADGWRIFLASLPLILIACLIGYLFGMADQALFGAPSPPQSKPVAETASWWGPAVLHAARILLLHVILPLIAIHLWIMTVREGLAAAFKGFKRVLTGALAPRSLLIYVAICAVFGAIVYLLLFQTISFESEWIELWAVGIKTALALALTFIGWLLTLGSIAELTTRQTMRELEA